MPLRVAINGLGRIGRLALRSLWDNPHIDVVVANSRSSAEQYAYLITHDSCYGTWNKDITAPNNDTLLIDGKPLIFMHGDEPSKCDWKKHDIDVVIESTGVFRNRAQSSGHLAAGAKRVIITAPSDDADATLLPGINLDLFDASVHKLISIASCTTNCLAPVAKIMHEQFGIVRGFMNTVHAYTNDQRLVDSPHQKEDFRRARAATESIIPTSTGAADAIGAVLPELSGKLSGIAMRVPVEVVSIVSFTADLQKETTVKELNNAFKHAANNAYKNVLGYSDKPLVSVDYKQNGHASIIDALSTNVIEGKLATVLAWYDNEWGYVQQLVRLLEYIHASR